eukprot:TRINITY_DN22036_c0_g1_i1.p1 TRINITY_DN22036_c0_g1~~TRINITY_DN22036_c0_g1_i1.p1  ORF type:complete len:290 (+),score=41.37 TRINITY_DN22036_c0_g1_i1:45-914(+)
MAIGSRQLRAIGTGIVVAFVWTACVVLTIQNSHKEQLHSLEIRQAELEERIALLSGADAVRQATSPTAEGIANVAARTTASDPVAVPSGGDALPPFAKPRRLAGVMNIVAAGSNTATSGCLSVGATATFSMSSATCDNSARCPPCFLATGLSGAITITIGGCSTARVGSAAMSNQIMGYTFINADGTNTMTITDGTNSYILAPKESVEAFCWTGGSDTLYFPEASGTTGFCPEGCDTANPKNRANANFGAVEFLDITVAGHLVDTAPPIAAIDFQATAACAGNKYVCHA